jgi:GMP synthase-like glutamine amidotransferase
MAMRLDKWYAMRDRQEQEFLSSPIKHKLDEAYLRRNAINEAVMGAIMSGGKATAFQEERLCHAEAEIEALKKELKKTESRRSR